MTNREYEFIEWSWYKRRLKCKDCHKKYNKDFIVLHLDGKKVKDENFNRMRVLCPECYKKRQKFKKPKKVLDIYK